MKNKGFTLIELLVVISIISLLSSIVLASVASARVKARDAVTVQNIKQLTLAMELYYNDYGFYPGALNTFYNCDVTNNFYCDYNSGFNPGDGFNQLEQALSPYFKSLDFITDSFYVDGFSAFYEFNIPQATGLDYYSCSTKSFSKYVFFFPIYDASFRETNLPFAKDFGGPSLFGITYYCVGV
jgi:prepilin-type N-terminal cleavage/methylation domain-containing protein